MLRSLLYVLAGVTVFAAVLGLGSIFFRGKEYTIEELYAETKTRAVRPEQLKLVSIAKNEGSERTPISEFVALLDSDSDVFQSTLNRIRTNWHPGDTAMLVELQQFHSDYFKGHLFQTISDGTGERIAPDQEAHCQWLWKQSEVPHPQYLEFKSSIYTKMDNRFATFFSADQNSLIPFTEIRWTGLQIDGIPPLVNPATVSVTDAKFLSDDDVVFGVEVDGEARAYPKKILAWHEMVKDKVGGVDISGVYCTLCESMIIFRSKLDGVHHELGTSGFLYRSNKLMYDKQTFSMWSSYDGRPVVGPLVGKDIRLEREPVVTTSWAQWKKLHPNTSVLSRRTGFRRNYGEETAFRNYMATDKLIFSVPTLDARLKNKAEVFVIDGGDTVENPAPLALSVEFLRKNTVYVADSYESPIVVLTDSTGANRAYQTNGVTFTQLSDDDTTVMDDQGRSWTVTENKLILDNQPGNAEENHLLRIPAHRSFWFGWYAAHPDTKLIL